MASQTQAELEEKRKQLELEMKKEEEFDKHLAHLAPVSYMVIKKHLEWKNIRVY